MQVSRASARQGSNKLLCGRVELMCNGGLCQTADVQVLPASLKGPALVLGLL